MNAAATTVRLQVPQRFQGCEQTPVTLLELVSAICEVTDHDGEVVATVLHMLATGRVRLCGNFRGSSYRELS
jgi:hypothetical protein